MFYRNTTRRNLPRMRDEKNLPLVLTNISYMSCFMSFLNDRILLGSQTIPELVVQAVPETDLPASSSKC